MASIAWDPKDPDETLDYELDWSVRLPAGDTLVTSNWELPAGLTNASQGIVGSGLISVIWLSGGTLGETYVITNTVETAQSRTMQQSVKLKIKAR